MDKIQVSDRIKEKLSTYCAATPETATTEQVYKAVAITLRDILIKNKQDFNQKVQSAGSKRVYYLCMEFLLGKSLKNNLFNLGLTKEYEEALKQMGFKLDTLLEMESDAGLGNGGLGRLAACFMDSLSTLRYPAMGFSILYEYGFFRQKIVENTQVELPDMWLETGEVHLLPRSDKNFTVKLGGYVDCSERDGRLIFSHRDAEEIEAMPYDYMVSGYNGGSSTLRLWKAQAKRRFDMDKFARGDYMRANSADNEAELISKVLYPSDQHIEGKRLRLCQQYLLVSASLQSIIHDHLKWNKTLNNLPDRAVIHINDTHPALAIPELMRLLMDEHGCGWDKAWNITSSVMCYTNHTVLSEALESWDNDLIEGRLPRIYMIINEIDNRFKAANRNMGEKFLSETAILWGRRVRMANLCVIGSRSVNGVSALHTDIIKDTLFNDFYKIYPEKFINVTNGIAHRRWLCQSNPELSSLITSLIGDGFITDASRLNELDIYKDDKAVLKKISDIKQRNKIFFADYLAKTYGEKINPYTRFDVQIKRLHEYKRQLMNCLKIIHLYLDLLDNPDKAVVPQTFIFGAKAAGGYMHAKRVITLINCLQKEIRANKKINEKLDVLFLENYNVTNAEKLIPASEVSQQISLAGKEASGTSNMKFMINGALTLGTVDGANVEIIENVGEENFFVFGLLAGEVKDAFCYSDPSALYSRSLRIKRVIDSLKTGFAGQIFADIANYLTIGSGTVADPFMCLTDFDSYLITHERMEAAYTDRMRWNKMSLINISKAGVFASDRAIKDYAANIWHCKPLK